jgi:hypothetical protein
MVECWHPDPAMRPSFLDIMVRISAIGSSPTKASALDDAPSPGERGSEMSLSSDHSWGANALAPATDADVAVACTDVADAASLWEMAPQAMCEAMLRHNQLLRRLLSDHHGYESTCLPLQQQDQDEGSFCFVFADPADALQWYEYLGSLHQCVAGRLSPLTPWNAFAPTYQVRGSAAADRLHSLAAAAGLGSSAARRTHR